MKTKSYFNFLKRKLMILYAIMLMALFSSGPLLAQMMDVGSTDAGGASAGLQYGPKLGGTFNQFTQPGTMIGINLGVFARYSVMSWLDVQGELLYTTMGGGRESYTRDFSAIGGEISQVTYVNRSVILQNVELPVTGRFTMNSIAAGTVIPHLIVGGSIGYNLAAFETHDKFYGLADGTQIAITNKVENVGGDYENLMYGFHVGVAVDYKLNDGKVFTTELRYRQGMNNVNSVKTVPQQRGVLYLSSLGINFSLTL